MDTVCGADGLAAQLAAEEPRAPGWDGLEFDGLSQAGAVDAVTACDRLVRHAQALLLRALGALGRRGGTSDLDRACTQAQVAVVLRLAPSTARARLELAGALAGRLPETLDALGQGRIGWAQANALVKATVVLDEGTARAVQARVLPRMEAQSTAATRKAVRRAVLALDPHGAELRHRRQAQRRVLQVRSEPDGMATVSLYTTASIAAALLAALDRHARQPQQEGDKRTLDQRRADAMATLVLHGAGVCTCTGASAGADVSGDGVAGSDGTQHPGTAAGAAGRAVLPAALVHVTVGIGTLLGTDQQPGELRGHGPLGAAQARALAFAPGSLWRRLITTPDGILLHADPRTYRPPAALDRLVRLRDQYCTFPGCTMPAAYCDIDHIEPFNHADPEAGGPTTPENLQALCRHHHQLKTTGRWNATRDENSTTTTWTAPTGHTYTTEPPTYPATG
ncbi:MAG: DUF222 domain-containing protein [Actinocrinis sp.]